MNRRHFALFCLFISLPAFAGRTLNVPHLARRTQLEYNNDGKLLGNVLTIMLSVKNLSTIPQKVTVHLAPGAYAYTNSTDITVCMGMNGSAATINSVNGTAKVPPKPTALEDIHNSAIIPPNDIGVFLIFAAFKSNPTYPNRIWSTLFFPSLQIEVDKDEGAVVATASMHTESCLGVAKETCNCNGTSEPKNYQTDSGVNLASPVLEINGGRPF